MLSPTQPKVPFEDTQKSTESNVTKISCLITLIYWGIFLINNPKKVTPKEAKTVETKIFEQIKEKTFFKAMCTSKRIHYSTKKFFFLYISCKKELNLLEAVWKSLPSLFFLILHMVWGLFFSQFEWQNCSSDYFSLHENNFTLFLFSVGKEVSKCQNIINLELVSLLAKINLLKG